MNKTTTLVAAALPARRLQAVMVGMVLTLLAAISVTAWAQPAPPPPGPRAEGGPGPHAGGPGPHHMHGGGMHGDMMFAGSPEQVGRMVDHLLDGIDATDAQRGQVKQIAVAAAADVKAQMQSARGLHERGMQVFMQPNVDPAAVEQLRQQMLQQHDQASRRVSQAMIDIARVLTPEQRLKLGQRMMDRRAMTADRMKRMGHTPPPR